MNAGGSHDTIYRVWRRPLAIRHARSLMHHIVPMRADGFVIRSEEKVSP